MAKKPNLTTISSGFASNAQLNENFQKLRDALDNFLSLNGDTPNAMQANLDMNGNKIINVEGIMVGGADILSLLNRITVSQDAPSGGADGDIWFRVTV